jgi:hypothetical protein
VQHCITSSRLYLRRINCSAEGEVVYFLGLFIAFGFDKPLKETSFLSSSQNSSRQRERDVELDAVAFRAREKKRRECTSGFQSQTHGHQVSKKCRRENSECERIALRGFERRTTHWAAWTAAWCDPPEKIRARISLLSSLSLSLSVSLCLFLSLTNARAQKKIEQEVERFLKSESATTSCSLVERIARTSGPAICRASNSNDYIYSRFKGTGLTLIGFERRPTKRSIREFFWPSREFPYLCFIISLVRARQYFFFSVEIESVINIWKKT